jgi:hypothetical protein
MKVAAIICNILSLAFTGLVFVTDGPAREPIYVVFGLLLLLVPLLSLAVLSRFSKNAALKIMAGILNIVLLGFIGWALVDQYPHPNEEGFIPYVVLMVLTPMLTLAALFWKKKNA